VLLTIYSKNSHAQRIAGFSIELTADKTGLDIPVSINLDSITKLLASSLSLSETTDNTITTISFQVSQDKPRRLYWIVNAQNQLTKRIYQLSKSAPATFNILEAINKEGAITFRSDNRNLLRYQFQTVYPPAGIDTNYKRSGFIHPLWTPHGQVLTRIQPPDHYHHYGIWNPWTHTVFEKDTVDFWNIKGHQGTVRFAKFISQTNGPVFSEFEVLHEHVVFKKDGSEKIALNEIQTVRVYNPQGQKDYFIVDITSQLRCATDSPLLIVAYRYAGLGWRATEEWTKDNCEVFTSEGTTRKKTDGVKARWIATQGTLGNDYGGVVMMSYPANYNHPEPLRIWDEKANGGRGDMFANFAPTKDKDWLLEPGKTYTLKYRLLVYNGKMSVQKAEGAWQYFAMPPKIIADKGH
jgi:hypothetical protein